MDDVFVPAERTCVPMVDEPCLDDPIARIPPPTFAPLAIASVAVGTARAALDDIRALAVDRVPLLAHDPLAANPLFQFELATADTELRAARALIYDAAASTWQTAAAGNPFTLEQRARIRAAAVWATERAVAVVSSAYRAGGGSSLYADCPLQRRLRDINAVTQHFLVKRDTLTVAGAIFAGRALEVSVF